MLASTRSLLGRLTSGMPAEVFIRTRERTALAYLMKPIADQLNRAFREN